MPQVKIIATEHMDPSNTQGFAFDYTHLPPMNDKTIVEKYRVDFRWYQNVDLGRPSRPSSYYTYAYDWKNDKWEYAAYFEGNYEIGAKGWRVQTLTRKLTPTTNKIGGVAQYSYFDRTLGGDTSPYIIVDYTLRVPTIKLNKTSDTKENEEVNISWSSDLLQANYELRYTNDGVIKNLSGTTAKNITLGKYKLKPGQLEYEVRVSNGYAWSEWAKGSVDILEHPIYLTLEPNKIAQNKDKAIVAMWSTSDIQTQFELIYSGSVSGKITGTIAKTHTFPAGIFGNGTVTLTLRVFNGYVWTEKIAEFMAYGAPPNPTLTTQATYATAIPNFTWTATEQVSYRVQVLKNDIIVLDSADIYSSSRNHRFTNVLENNTTYTVRLRIRNQYEIESEWVSKAFTVAFTELQKPNFDMFANDRLGTIMFNIYNAVGQANFSYCEILRREYGEIAWNKIESNLPLTAAYTDYTCRSGILYEYKVRAIGTSGGYTDSEIGLKEVSLRNTMMSDTTDFDNYVILIHNPKKARTHKKETHMMQYSGSRMPKFEFGDAKFQTMNTSFTVDEKTLDKLLELHHSNNVLLIRDNRGKKLYGYISSDIADEDAEFDKYNVSFVFTETDYKEEVLV